MSPLVVGALGFAAVLVLSLLRAPLALSLALVGAAGTGLTAGWPTFFYVIGTAPFDVLNNYQISVIPLFIFMGALAVPTGLGTDLVIGANAFLGHRRGGLAMGSVLSCALFGRISGSDIADLSTMAKITVPGMLKYGYHPRLAAGSVASAATLAILMPPSVPLIIYATMTETSIGRIFAGGLIPGVILTVMFIGVIFLWVTWDKSVAPRSAPQPLAHRWKALKGLWGVLVIFGVMMGGLYVGYFSPTEAASVGAGGVILVALLQRRLSWEDFVASVREATRLSAVIFFVLIGVHLFHYFIVSTHLAQALSQLITGLHIAPMAVMAVILIALVLLGCVMDSLTILLITVPFLHPIVLSLGYDSIWFGIVMAMVVQLGLIHPPFGMNVFVLSSLVPEIRIGEAFWGCVPFVIANIVLIGLVLVFPQLVTWIPNQMYN